MRKLSECLWENNPLSFFECPVGGSRGLKQTTVELQFVFILNKKTAIFFVVVFRYLLNVLESSRYY